MLPLLNQFILKQAIRSPLYLLNPNIVHQDNISLPKLSILHYLDTNQDNHFPVRELYYFSNVSENKKIPIYHINDLETKTEVSSLLNKQVNSEIRKWQQSNNKNFKTINLLEVPNTEENIISVFNYNLLKDLYKYRTSPLSNYYRFYNLYNTYYTTIKKAINLDNQSIHFISINLPNNIPNFNIINVLLKFTIVKYSRLISDSNLLQIIDIYKWLLNSTRNNSTLSEITDQESKKIIIEFKYKEHSCFLPLYLIRSLSKDSELDSQLKVPDIKIQKLFILMLHKFQDKINEIIENNIKTTDIPDDTLEKTSNEIKNEDVIEDQQDTDYPSDKDVMDSFPDIKGLTNSNNFTKIENNIENNLDISNFNSIIDNEISKFEIDNEETDRLYEESILKAEEEVEQITEEPLLKIEYSEDKTKSLLTNRTTDDKFDKFIKEAVEFKTLTSTEIRSLKKIKEARNLLKSPYDNNTQIDQFKIIDSNSVKLSEEELKLNIDTPLVENSMKKEVINNFNQKYIKNVLKKDIIACVSHLENSNIIIKDYTIEENKTSLGNYEIHKLTLKPYNGKESTIYFRLPKIDSEGEFIASGIKYKMRAQRADYPIRKISPTRVALTSNYGKLFIFRTDRKANDPFSYVADYIRNNYINEEGMIIKIIPGGHNLSEYHLPNIYSYLSSQFTEIHTPKFTLLLNYKERKNYLDEKVLNEIEKQNLTFCGYLSNKNILVIDHKENFFNYSENMSYVGTLDEMLEIDKDKLPKSFSTIKVLGDNIPLGVCLAYYLGLTELISITNTQVRTIEANKQYKANRNELVLKFNDFKLILEIPNKETELLFNGFLFYKDFIKQHSIREFNYKDIYLNLLEFRDSGLMHIKELNLLQELFLDPITVDVLKSISEPTDYLRLLLRANELLKDFSYPDINDPSYSRIRGYDRVPGLMYKALSESIRDHRFKGNAKGKIELDPYKVWNFVTQDSTVKITEDINPILDVKESETVTLSGSDGLNKDATPKLLRRYHKNDMGLISEGTVDSSDVALNTYMTPYAKLKDVRGLVDNSNLEHIEEKGKLFSTSVLLAPMSELDDAKRINFCQIQNGHTIYSSGYQQPILRTGYEYILPYRVGKLYCAIAKDNGEVIGKTDKLLTVKYKSGETESISIGNRYGRMEGSVYPHSIISNLNIGQKFKKDDYLVYNENFFEKDWIDPSKLVLKFGRNVTTALTMNDEVFEDSSAISSELSKEMSTVVVKEKIFIVEFSKNIINIIPEGAKVDPNTVLFTVIDENTDYNNLSESTIEMLQNLAALSPKAKVNGIVDRYEVKYNGELSDMSPSLKKLVNRLDKLNYDESKGTEYEIVNNRVTSEYRSEGKNLNIDTLELKVFIKIELSQAVGDKGVFANQMKSVVSNVYNYNVTTESGVSVEAMFSYKGILNRTVISPVLMGTTNRLVKHVSKQVADIYFGK